MLEEYGKINRQSEEIKKLRKEIASKNKRIEELRKFNVTAYSDGYDDCKKDYNIKD